MGSGGGSKKMKMQPTERESEPVTFGSVHRSSLGQPLIGTRQLVVYALLATVCMLFAGFASAYLVRRAGTDWEQIPLPHILWYNSVLLLLSSATIEAARTAQRHSNFPKAKIWLGVSTALGLSFVGGQLLAWKQMADQGFFLPTSPYSSFFYMLTAVHGVHLLGGMIALTYLLFRISRAESYEINSDLMDSCATYWHFVDGIWVFLYLLMLLY